MPLRAGQRRVRARRRGSCGLAGRTGGCAIDAITISFDELAKLSPTIWLAGGALLVLILAVWLHSLLRVNRLRRELVILQRNVRTLIADREQASLRHAREAGAPPQGRSPAS